MWCRRRPQRAGRTLAGLGIEPVSFRAVVPTYLWRFRKSGQFKTSARSEQTASIFAFVATKTGSTP